MDLAEDASTLILRYLKNYRKAFKEQSRKAKGWFERRAWTEAHVGLNERTELYSDSVTELVAALRVKLGARSTDREVWLQIKEAYRRDIANMADEELAETFYNSVTRRLFKTIGIDFDIELVWLDGMLLPSGEESPIFRSYYPAAGSAQMFEEILESCEFDASWVDMSKDAKMTAERVEAILRDRSGSADFDAVELLEPILYRSKGAYLVGRVRRGHHIVPIILPLLHDEHGIRVDAVVASEAETSTIFSFTRSYFMVDVERPAELVGFIRTLIPRKPLDEIYISLGFIKHGKTIRYRELYRHFESSLDNFEVAPGAKGMVMAVFHLPSYHLVFKVIRDKFAAPKTTTKAKVHETYRLVETHDRAGRLVDAQAFERMRFPLRRFSEPVLEELLGECSEAVRKEGEEIILEHVYVQRKIIPLNLYVHQVEEKRALEAVVDHGQSIRDLAAIGLFPGDLLVKNFGVTRRGRVVFYDYDEIVPLKECKFHRLPDSDGYGLEPSVVAGEMDIYPEELSHFLWGTPHLKKAFAEAHGDLFTVKWWRQMQRQVGEGKLPDIFPYAQAMRFPQPGQSEAGTSPEAIEATGSSERADQSHQEPS